MRPHAFEKVESGEVREIIERCTRLRKEERPSVKELLNHEFFSGLKVEVVSRDEAVASHGEKVDFRLRVLDPKKRRDMHKENEAIQFEFNVNNDDADKVAQDMVNIDFLFV